MRAAPLTASSSLTPVNSPFQLECLPPSVACEFHRDWNHLSVAIVHRRRIEAHAQQESVQSITENVMTYDVVITVANSDLKLFPGMTANVTLVATKVDDTLKVPNASAPNVVQRAFLWNNAISSRRMWSKKYLAWKVRRGEMV